MAVKLTDLSPEEVRKLKQQLRAEEKAKSEKSTQARKEYERNKEKFLKEVERKAKKAQADMIALKAFIFEGAKKLQAEMFDLGEIKKDSGKGGFSIRNSQDTFKLTYQPRGIKEFDETVAIAEEKLRLFLEKTVKRSNQLHFTMIEAILKKSSTGDYNPDLVNRLVEIQEQINHPDFDQVVELFQKAWKEVDTTTYVNLYERVGQQNAFEHLCLQFSKLPV